MKDRVKWQKETYPKFWTNQVAKYGFDNYCKGLFDLVLSKKPSTAYELAIGTGWPFAINLQNNGVLLSGSDIAEFLIEGIHLQYPKINAKVASYEDLYLVETDKYNVVYCFRSTWYFPDILKAIDAMFNLVTKPGWVIFDIMNIESKYIQWITIKHRMLIPYTIIKNLIKLTMNLIFNKNYIIQHIWKLPELPISPKLIENYLISRNVIYKKYTINQITNESATEFRPINSYDSKIIFECQII